MSGGARVLIGFLVVAAIAGAYVLTRQRPAPPPPIAAPVPAPVVTPPPPDAAPAPAIRHPIEATAAKPLPSLDEADAYVKNALADLIGRKAMSLLALDGFVRRFVATVDNLGRESAPAHLWPVNPTPGTFAAQAAGKGSVIAAQNTARYAALVALAEALDARRAVALYVRLYPLCQQAYEDLGYPGKYFNDRLVEVIDDLLATPDVPGPIAIRAVAPTAAGATRTLYQFEDPALEALPAGRKILLRVGPENARRLKAKLVEVRAQIARKPPTSRR